MHMHFLLVEFPFIYRHQRELVWHLHDEILFLTFSSGWAGSRFLSLNFRQTVRFMRQNSVYRRLQLNIWLERVNTCLLYTSCDSESVVIS